MKRTTIVLAVAAALAIPVSAGAAGQSLKFCTDPTFPPMESATTSGSMVGFDIDMAKAIGTQWGGGSKPVKTAFPGLLPALGAKKCDAVISGIFITPDRTKQFPAVAYLFPQQDAFGIYYRKGDAIGPQLKTAVAKLRSVGTLSKLAAKYKLPAQDVK